MQEKEFNLVYEPWILVLNLNGEQEEVSLLKALERAHEFKCLAGELPTQDVAVLRLLLAALYATFTRVDAQGKRKSIGSYEEALARWESLWQLGRFPTEPIKERLCRYEERFYLFHPERPFYQVAGLDRGTSYTAAKLFGNLSESSNKVRLFPVRTGQSKYAMSFSEAARWLLYVNAFDDTSSKPSKRGGEKMPSPGAGWLGKIGLVFANGTNLFETLMLNFVLVNFEERGKPWGDGKAVWELNEPRTEERVEIVLPLEPLSLLTLQSRRILLQREENSVIGYLLLGGDFFHRENAFTEQMTIWRKDEKNNVYLPKRHDPSKQLWRDFSSFISYGEGQKTPGVVRWLAALKEKGHINSIITLRVASVKYGDKDFFVTDVFQDSLTVNSGILSKMGQEWVIRINNVLSLTDECVKKIYFLTSEIARASGDSDSQKGKAGEGATSAAKAEAYFRLDMPFRSWLAGIDPLITDVEEAEVEWKDTLKRILLQLGEELVHQSGEKGIVGRIVGDKLYTAPGALVKYRSSIISAIEKGG